MSRPKRRYSDRDKAFIYGLRGADESRYFYIGSTKSTIAGRLAGHLSDVRLNRQGNARLASAIRKRNSIIADEIEITNESSRFEREEYWIASYLNQGHPLCNLQLTPTIYGKSKSYTGKDIARRACLLFTPRKASEDPGNREIATYLERVGVRLFFHALRIDSPGFVRLCQSDEAVES